MILDLNGKIRVGGTVALTDAVRTLVGQGWPAIVLNLSEVTQVDSAGFGALLEARQAALGIDGQLALFGTSRLHPLLILCALLTHFRVFASERGALDELAWERPFSDRAA